ncbi:MAG: hypothetical protein K8M05_04285, partial [Deltaproteobacteria bacterium]|nr:hypothetical protein [Kofleriaceae bacterium]
ERGEAVALDVGALAAEGPLGRAGRVDEVEARVEPDRELARAQLDLAGRRRDFATELRTRELTIGLYPCLHFIDPAGAAERALRRERAHVERDRLAALALCWTNDLVSLRKELRAGESHNLVLALRARRGDGLQAAVDEAISRYHRTLVAFANRDTLCRAADPGTTAYSDGLRAWIAALPAWSYAGGRYD